MPSDGVAHPSSSTVSPPKSVTTEVSLLMLIVSRLMFLNIYNSSPVIVSCLYSIQNTALGPDVAPDPLNPVAPLDPLPSVVVVATSVVAPNPPEVDGGFLNILYLIDKFFLIHQLCMYTVFF